MALVEDNWFEREPRPELRLVDSVPGQDAIGSNTATAETLDSVSSGNENTTYIEEIKSSVYGWLEEFRKSGQGYNNDEAFGRHGITVGTPDNSGFAADYAYVTVPDGGYYRLEQYRQGETLVATYISLIEDDGTFYPPAGIVIEGQPRSVNNPIGYGTSPELSELPSDILAQLSQDLQRTIPE